MFSDSTAMSSLPGIFSLIQMAQPKTVYLYSLSTCKLLFNILITIILNLINLCSSSIAFKILVGILEILGIGIEEFRSVGLRWALDKA